MCGRYYVNENTVYAVEDALKQIGVQADYHDLCHKVLVYHSDYRSQFFRKNGT